MHKNLGLQHEGESNQSQLNYQEFIRETSLSSAYTLITKVARGHVQKP